MKLLGKYMVSKDMKHIILIAKITRVIDNYIYFRIITSNGIWGTKNDYFQKEYILKEYDIMDKNKVVAMIV